MTGCGEQGGIREALWAGAKKMFCRRFAVRYGISGGGKKKFFGGEGLSAFFIAYICPMETLDVLCAGERARIVKIDSVPEVRERLKMLNVFPGSEIRLLKTVFFRRTFLLEADGVRLGLRRDLAKKIFVRREKGTAECGLAENATHGGATSGTAREISGAGAAKESGKRKPGKPNGRTGAGRGRAGS